MGLDTSGIEYVAIAGAGGEKGEGGENGEM
jgi:hypothetical protein